MTGVLAISLVINPAGMRLVVLAKLRDRLGLLEAKNTGGFLGGLGASADGL